MNNLVPSALRDRLFAVWVFLATALAAILAGGMVSAAMAHAPARPMMWMVAYLVLVVGVAQGVLGFGQALLPARLPSLRWRVGEWVLFNAGNAGVIVGTLLVSTWLTVVGTALFIASLVAFLIGVRGAGNGGWLLHVFRAVLAIVCVGACAGLVLSIIGIAH